MHNNRIRLFEVSYIRSYRLQCAWQNYLCQPRSLDNTSSVRPSFAAKELFPIAVTSSIDALSCNSPIALLDPDGAHVTEVNPAAEAAGVQTGITTNLATARAPHLILLARAPALEAQLQNTFLQLSYRCSPYLENS